MLYLAIPAHNEAATIGVLLWRLRTVLAEFPREYEAVVYDDASSDSTSEILESYSKVMPLTVIRGERQVGYAGAVDALVRHVARDTRYPRRDAMLLLQGDFTDSPTLVPEFVKRFEGGTDIVVGERGRTVRRKAPAPVKRLLQVEPWLTRFLVRAEGIRDLTSSYRLVRISVLRDLLRSLGEAPVCAGDPRTANADFLMRIVPLARRVEALPVEPTWEVRLRETRVVAVPDAMSLLRWAWRSRGRRAVPSTAPEPADTSRSRAPREGRADLRLEGRSEWSSDAAVTAEGTRATHTRDAGGGRNRKSRTGRHEKTESRGDARVDNRGAEKNESRNDGRNEARAERANARAARADQRANQKSESVSDNRADARTESRPDGRNDRRPDNRSAVQPVPPEESVLADALDTENGSEQATRERPARRKRSRGSRRERLARAREAGGESLENTDGDETTATGPRASPPEISDGGDQAADSTEAEFGNEVELSRSLSDAVDDVEQALDGNGRTRPPRKKRRRRGSRGGRAGAAGASAGEDTADGSGESMASRGSAIEANGLGDPVDFADGEAADAGTDGDVGEAGGLENGGESGGRVRRRGRRGRRGGARRSRPAREEGESNSGGEDFSSPPPSAPAPEL